MKTPSLPASSRDAQIASLGHTVLRFQRADQTGNQREADRLWAKIEREISTEFRLFAIKNTYTLTINEAHVAALEGVLLGCQSWDPDRGPLHPHLQAKARFEILKAAHRDSPFAECTLSGRSILNRLADRLGYDMQDMTPEIVDREAENESERSRMRAALSMPIKQICSLDQAAEDGIQIIELARDDDGFSQVDYESGLDHWWEEALEGLSPLQKRAMLATYRYCENSMKDAAEMLGENYKHVDNAVMNAKRHLRAKAGRGELALLPC